MTKKARTQGNRKNVASLDSRLRGNDENAETVDQEREKALLDDGIRWRAMPEVNRLGCVWIPGQARNDNCPSTNRSAHRADRFPL